MLRYDIQTKPGLVALYDIRPASKRSGSILTTPEPTQGKKPYVCLAYFNLSFYRFQRE